MTLAMFVQIWKVSSLPGLEVVQFLCLMVCIIGLGPNSDSDRRFFKLYLIAIIATLNFYVTLEPRFATCVHFTSFATSIALMIIYNTDNEHVEQDH
jgi:hypothetical protein